VQRNQVNSWLHPDLNYSMKQKHCTIFIFSKTFPNHDALASAQLEKFETK